MRSPARAPCLARTRSSWVRPSCFRAVVFPACPAPVLEAGLRCSASVLLTARTDCRHAWVNLLAETYG